MMNPSAYALLRPVQNAAVRLSLAGALLFSGCDHASVADGYRRAHPSAGKLSPLGTRCPAPVPPPAPDRGDGAEALARINHFVVIYLENHSFDSLYGLFPGADGLLDENCELTTPLQVDRTGTPYTTLEPVPTSYDGFTNLPNQPFSMDARVPPEMIPPDLTHSFYAQQAQINGGQMNQFVAFSSGAAATVAYYDTAKLPLAKLAQKYTLCDQFFQSAFGGSYLNHIWLIAARTPYAPSLIDPNRQPEVGASGKPFPVDAEGAFSGFDPQVTYDGFAVNTIQPSNFPHAADPVLLPSMTDPTIGDRLSEAGISWAWYSGGWREVTDSPLASPGLFQFHHQPFVYFENFKEGTAARAEHLKDELDFLKDAKNGTLPAVSFLKPHGSENEHPGYTNLRAGEDYAVRMVEAVMSSPNWADTAIIITYDENGGFADHVAPPIIDRWGPGTRVPAIVISNYAKKGFVDHTQYETVSILATIEHRFGLSPLSPRDAIANDLTRTLTLSE